ncbi:serum response factor-like [Sinocyclocheilus grahami]|uniref:serum response factor-like n=1 Tax=Sinocyclocheilus grahami TaxID=75366 RepID=UPI0007ACA068|nr:PREDICTED: serum response factor-like [Sinocyclocheilus grahami]
MLSSQSAAALSGSGSAAGKSAGHGAVVLGAGVRAGFARGLGPMGLGIPGRFEPDKEGPPHLCSGSDADSDSGDEDELMGSVGDNRRGGGVKRERAEMEAAMVGPEAGLPSAALAGGAAGAKPGKKTRGRVKIKMEFIDNKLRRYTTFSKRKTGIMKKAYELSTLTGTQVLLLVASETGHVYTFATRKLQPMITSETGKALIQTCLNSPDSPPRSDPSTDQRMSATGFEETDLTYQVSESESLGETKDALKPAFSVASTTVPSSSSSSSFPITNYLPSAGASGAKSAGVMQLPAGFTFMSGSPFAPGTPAIPLGQSITASSSGASQPSQGQQAVFRLPATVSLTGGVMPQQLQSIQVQSSGHSSCISTSASSPELSHFSLPAIVTTSVPTSMTGHMMYPSPHTLMYASAPTLADGSVAVLNAFTQGQMSHTPTQDTVSLPAIVTTSVPTSMTGHMMYPSPHTLMYASAPTLADGSVAVLNAFTQGQVSHTPTQDTGS